MSKKSVTSKPVTAPCGRAPVGWEDFREHPRFPTISQSLAGLMKEDLKTLESLLQRDRAASSGGQARPRKTKAQPWNC